MGNKTLSLALMASMLGSACGEPKKAAVNPDVPVQVSAPVVQQEPPNLDSLIKSQVVQQFGVDENRLEVQNKDYDSKNYPFHDFVLEEYRVVSSPDNQRSFLFSLGGKYIGQVAKLQGEKDAWISQRAGSKSKEGYKYEKGRRVNLFIENELEDGKLERDLRISQVYKIAGGKLAKDKPYYGVYGGDSQHFLDDRGPGLYFEVNKIIFQKVNGALVPIEEIGVFFNQNKNTPNRFDQVAVGVKRKVGQNAFSLWDEYGGTQNDTALYNKIVPKNLRQK
jgi:hypothetical protein